MNYHEERRQFAAAQARYDAMMPHEYEPTQEEINEAALEEAQQELADTERLLEDAEVEHEYATFAMLGYMDRVRQLKAEIAELEAGI